MASSYNIYCAFCGNVHVRDCEQPCAACARILRGPLAQAFAFYKRLQREHSQCCGGLNSEKDHLFFHGKGWECSYPEHAAERESQTCVEMGVALYSDHAATYYIFDNDSTTMSEEYGITFTYGERVMMRKLMRQLDLAAECAWNSDILTCEHCGYHYHVGNGPCGCSGDVDASSSNSD